MVKNNYCLKSLKYLNKIFCDKNSDKTGTKWKKTALTFFILTGRQYP